MSKGQSKQNKQILLSKPLPSEKREILKDRLTKDIKSSLKKLKEKDRKQLLPAENVSEFVNQLEESVYRRFLLLGSLKSYNEQLLNLRYNLINNTYYLLKNFEVGQLFKMKPAELGQSGQSGQSVESGQSEENVKNNYYPINQFKNDLRNNTENKNRELKGQGQGQENESLNKKGVKYDVSELQAIVEDIQKRKIEPLLILKDEDGKIITQSTSLEKCPRCKGGENNKNKVELKKFVSRAVDEGETVSCSCDCGYKWKIYN